MIKGKVEKSVVEVVLTYFVYIVLLLITINLFRTYLIPDFDYSRDFLGLRPLFIELVRFFETFNVNDLLNNLYKAFIIDIPDISDVGSLWDVIVGTFAEIGDLIMFPIYIIDFLANIVLSAFRFLAIFFGLQLPVS